MQGRVERVRTYPLVAAAAVALWNKTLRTVEKGKWLQWNDFVVFMSIHQVDAERCTSQTYGIYAMCEGAPLSHIVKVPCFKVPGQHSWELIAQRVHAHSKPPKQCSSKKARKKGLKQRGPRSNTDGATSKAYEDVVAGSPKGDSAPQWEHVAVVPLLVDEEYPLSEPEGNIVASSSEPAIEESPAFPASNSEDVPLDGMSVRGNIKAPR